MKVVDLGCPAGHRFEGWFQSEDDLQQQRADKLLSCPMCGDREVDKLPSAPRLNLGGSPTAPQGPKGGSGARQDVLAAMPSDLQAAWLQMVRQVMAKTEDVGDRFVQEARRMHYGEIEERGIRGQATREETRELLEEGIAVAPLPIPESLKKPLQ